MSTTESANTLIRKHRLAKVLAALLACFVPFAIAATPAPASALNGCYSARNFSTIISRCTGSGPQYQYIQTWVKCGTSNDWTRGNRIGNPWYQSNGLPKLSTVDCAPYQPRVWTFAYWL